MKGFISKKTGLKTRILAFSLALLMVIGMVDGNLQLADAAQGVNDAVAQDGVSFALNIAPGGTFASVPPGAYEKSTEATAGEDNLAGYSLQLSYGLAAAEGVTYSDVQAVLHLPAGSQVEFKENDLFTKAAATYDAATGTVTLRGNETAGVQGNVAIDVAISSDFTAGTIPMELSVVKNQQQEEEVVSTPVVLTQEVGFSTVVPTVEEVVEAKETPEVLDDTDATEDGQSEGDVEETVDQPEGEAEEAVEKPATEAEETSKKVEETQEEVKNLKASSDPIEITKVISTNAASFDVRKGAVDKLRVSIDYMVNNAAGGNGGVITFKLANTKGLPLFLQPTAADIVQKPANIGTPVISMDGNDIIVTLPVTGGAQNDQANIIIDIPFDHDTYNMWAANGEELADVSVTGSMNGTDSIQTLKVKALSTDSAAFIAYEKYPVKDTACDRLNVVDFSFKWAMNHASDDYWRFQPNTDLEIILTYPIGAEIVDAKGGTVNAAAGTITWKVGTADSNGEMPGANSNYGSSAWAYKIFGVAMKFPSSDPAFSLGSSHQVGVRAEYTRPGVNEPVKLVQQNRAPITFKIIEPTVDMGNNKFTNTGNPDSISIASPGTVGTWPSDYGSAANAGTEPIPDTCFIWYNDWDNSGKKLYPNAITVFQDAVVFDTRVEVYIKNSNGTNAGTKTGNIPKTTEPGLATQRTLSALGVTLGVGQYIDQIKLYPQDNGMDALPYMASMRINIHHAAPASLTYPNGNTIKHNDFVKEKATLSWKGESNPATQTDAAFDGMDTCTITLVDKVNQTHFYADTAPVPYVWYDLMTGGSILPGMEIETNLRFMNFIGDTLNCGEWKDPVLLVLPPDCLEFDVSQPLKLYDSTGNYKGDAMVSEVTTTDGKRMYKISTPSGTTAPRNNITTTAMSIPIKFKVKNGTASGTYNLSSDKAADGGYYSAKGGRLFGTSATPNKLVYPLSMGDSRWYDDTATDYDGSADTPYLRYPRVATGFTVAKSKDLQVTAQLWNTEANAGAGEWQDSNVSGAEATLPLGSNGMFKMEINNQGNLYVGGLRLYDILPQLLDKNAMDPLTARGSEWNATFDKLTYTIYDVGNNDVTTSFGSKTPLFCTSNDPSYDYLGLVRSGADGAFTNNGTLATAKSFLFDMGSDRLPPGYKIVIEGELKAPSSIDYSDIGKEAYNSFGVAGAYYNEATGTGGYELISAFEPAKQTFRIADDNSAKFTKDGFVWKDYNGNGTVDAGEPRYDGVTVKLYPANTAGDGPDTDKTPVTTTTDSNGQYTFENLPGGDYFIQVEVPTTLTNASFTTKGADTDNTKSHVSATGVSNKLTLNAGSATAVKTNAGIKRVGALDVKFLENNTSGAQIGSTVSKTDVTLPANGTITPGTTTGYDLPTGYQIKSATDNRLNYNLTWESNTATLKFVVEKIKYPVSFDLNYTGATGTPATQQVAYQEKATMPATDPERTGYTFSGWYTAATGGSVFDFDTQITASKTIYAQWTKKNYTVSFDLNYSGATGAPANQTIAYQGKATKPTTDPSRTGYKFEGWYTAATGGAVFDFANTEITENTTIYAQWSKLEYAVKFDLNYAGATGAPADQKVKYQEQATKPAGPSRTGYKFEGWYTAATGGSLYDFDTKITGAMTLYAQWSKVEYTVKFDLNYTGATGAPADQKVKYQELATKPTEPEREGYTFDGWFTKDSGGTEFAFSSMVITENVTVYAHWTPITYKVTFDKNGAPNEASPKTMKVTYPATTVSSLPTAPDFKGLRKFVEWNTKADGSGEKFTTSTKVTKDMTVYAVWNPVIVQYTVRYDSNGGETKANPSVQYVTTFDGLKGGSTGINTVQVLPTNPAREGYTFQGWNTKADGTGSAFTADTKVTDSLTVYAKWKKNTSVLPEDNENPEVPNKEFMKKPLNTSVAPGDLVDYAFTGFANNNSGTVDKYMITDYPPQGLDFVSGQLPAFTKGAGVTYRITYLTHSNPSKINVLQDNIPANKAFSFAAPKLASGDYLTAICVDMGSVPAGFGVDNVIIFTFRVASNPPTTTLTNSASLSYRWQGKTVDFRYGGNPITAVNPSRVVNGKVYGYGSSNSKAGNVKTGDTTPLFFFGIAAGAAVLLIILMLFKRRSKTE